MSITGFIQRTKSKANNMIEARKTALASQRQVRTESLRMENKVLHEEARERNALLRVRAENKKLKQERFNSTLPGKLVKNIQKNTRTKRKSGGDVFGGNSPFRQSNLKSDTTVNSPFSNMFSDGKKKKRN